MIWKYGILSIIAIESFLNVTVQASPRPEVLWSGAKPVANKQGVSLLWRYSSPFLQFPPMLNSTLRLDSWMALLTAHRMLCFVSLLVTRTLLGAPGIATRNKKLLGAPGIATRKEQRASLLGARSYYGLLASLLGTRSH